MFRTSLAVALLAARVLFAQPAPAQIDKLVQSEMAASQVPGLALTVVQNGAIVYAKGYGLANVEHRVPVTTDTIFQPASIAKQFTATAIMLLAESGKLRLDAKIGEYLARVPPSWSDITVRHLLTHTAGLPSYPNDFNYRRDYTEDELLQVIQSQTLAFKPGERWEYSNSAYVTLGIIIHRVSGKFWGDFLKEKIFTPLGMTTARVINEHAIIPNRAAGYLIYQGRLINQPWISPTLNRTADASLYMTVLDLAKWDAALYGDSLLPRARFEEMWKPATLNDGTKTQYGLGWFVLDAKGHRLIEHEGAWQGFNANISRYVDDKLTVIVMSNLKSAKTQMLSHRIAGLYIPAIATPVYEPIEDREPQVTAMVSDLMKRFAAGTANEPAFASVAKMYEQYLKPLGDPTTVQLVERTTVPEGRRYRYLFSYSSVTLLVTVTLNDEGKIVAVSAVDNW